MNIGLCWLAIISMFICRSPLENVTWGFVRISTSVPSVSCSSYLDTLWDGGKVVVQLLFYEVLLLEFVQNSTQFPCRFVLKRFIKVLMVQPCNSTVTARAWKNSRFISSERLDFHMVDNLSIAVHAFPMRMLTSLSVDEILEPMYVKSSTDYSALSFKVEMTPSCLKEWTLFYLVTCSRRYSRHSACTGVFARSTRSSA